MIQSLAAVLALAHPLLVAGPSVSANLINLATEPANVAVLGESLTANLGTSFAAGDVNGDGHKDLIVVACNTHPLGGQRTGTIYVIWGTGVGVPSIINLAQSPSGVSRILGSPDNDNLYCTVACGDFNDDGFDDIVWGSPQTGQNVSWSGRAYIILGRSSFPATLDLYLQPPGVVVIEGAVENGFLGRGLCACDMNGDGYEDLVVSAPWSEYSQVFIVHGREVFPPLVETGTVQPGLTRIVDDVANGNTGHGLDCRDINADSRADLLVGAIGAERVLLFYGATILPDNIFVANPAVPMKVINGEYAHGALGISVAFGDIDGNDTADAVLGAYLGDPAGCSDCGEVYIVYDIDELGETTNLGTTSARMTRIRGGGPATGDGYRVLCADLSGDAIDDLVVTNRPLNVTETTSIIYGRQVMPSTILLATENGPITRIRPVSNDDQLGRGIIAFDINLDTVCDLFVGAPYASPPGASYAGIAYGFSSPDLATSVGPNPSISNISVYPNPFALRTTISFEGTQSGPVDITIFDVAGRSVRTLKTVHDGGALRVDWDGKGQSGEHLPGGVYFCRIRARDRVETRKVVLIR